MLLYLEGRKINLAKQPEVLNGRDLQSTFHVD
jgi:hypothetical protein